MSRNVKECRSATDRRASRRPNRSSPQHPHVTNQPAIFGSRSAVIPRYRDTRFNQPARQRTHTIIKRVSSLNHLSTAARCVSMFEQCSNLYLLSRCLSRPTKSKQTSTRTNSSATLTNSSATLSRPSTIRYVHPRSWANLPVAPFKILFYKSPPIFFSKIQAACRLSQVSPIGLDFFIPGGGVGYVRLKFDCFLNTPPTTWCMVTYRVQILLRHREQRLQVDFLPACESVAFAVFSRFCSF
jgi:hypothetical protein